jgi:hypothetical protein
MKENEDYELVPMGEGDLWSVRFKSGEFVETVFHYGTIKVMEDKQHLSFDFEIDYTPMDWLTIENTDLQKAVGEVLYSILESSVGKEVK